MAKKVLASLLLTIGIGLFVFGIAVGPSLLPMPDRNGVEPYRKYDIRVIVWSVPGFLLASWGGRMLFEE